VKPLSSRGARLEYWFVKVHVDDLAFLVDLIVRRGDGTAEIRLSYWHAGDGTVTHETRSDWTTDAAGARVGPCAIADGMCTGRSEGVEWDLRFRAGPRWLVPGHAISWLRSADMEIESSPGARFDGTVRIGARRFDLHDAPGVVAHYWGARLPERWVWLSLNDAERDVDAVVALTRMWGIPWLRLETGYAYSADREGARYVISPLTGLVRSGVHGDEVGLRAVAPGRSFQISARSPRATRNDLGQGITQTLLGDVAVDGRMSTGRGGIETRGWRQ
jgi:hypothetical protein